MTGETVMLDRWPPLLTSGTVKVMLCPGEVTGEELTAPSAKPPISSTPMLLTTPESSPSPTTVTYSVRVKVTSSVMSVPLAASFLHTVALTVKFIG